MRKKKSSFISLTNNFSHEWFWWYSLLLFFSNLETKRRNEKKIIEQFKNKPYNRTEPPKNKTTNKKNHTPQILVQTRRYMNLIRRYDMVVKTLKNKKIAYVVVYQTFLIVPPRVSSCFDFGLVFDLYLDDTTCMAAEIKQTIPKNVSYTV